MWTVKWCNLSIYKGAVCPLGKVEKTHEDQTLRTHFIDDGSKHGTFEFLSLLMKFDLKRLRDRGLWSSGVSRFKCAPDNRQSEETTSSADFNETRGSLSKFHSVDINRQTSLSYQIFVANLDGWNARIDRSRWVVTIQGITRSSSLIQTRTEPSKLPRREIVEIVRILDVPTNILTTDLWRELSILLTLLATVRQRCSSAKVWRQHLTSFVGDLLLN